MKSTCNCIYLIVLSITISFTYSATLRQATATTAPLGDALSPTASAPVVTAQPAEPAKPVALTDAFCFINYEGKVYDLNGLKADGEDYRVKSAIGTVNFNVCRNLVTPCPGVESPERRTTGSASFITGLDSSTCTISGGNTTVSSKFFLLEDKAANKTELIMTLPEGDKCRSDASKTYLTTLTLVCDETAEVPQISTSPFNGNSCDIFVSMRTKHACPNFSVYGIWNQIQANKWLFGTIIIAAGIFFCFFGEEFVKASQIIAGGAVVLIFFMYIVFSYTSLEFNSWQFWLIVVLAVGAGCVAGYYMSLITWLPGLVFGGLLGFVLGFFIFNLALRFIQSNPAVVFWMTMVICISLGVLLGWFKEEEVCIISTAVVGGYAIIRGFSIWFGGFPDERQVYELANKGEWDQLSANLTAVVYAYLAGFILVAAAGMYIQFRFFYDTPEKNKSREQKEKEKKEKEEQKKLENQNLTQNSNA